MTFRKILCPVDFSAGSSEALRLATQMCGPETELVILHVWQPLPYSVDLAVVPELMDRINAEISAELEDSRRQAEHLGARRVSTLLRTGAPWREIVRILESDHALDLAVIATHGRSGIAHVVLGSVAEKVIRHARCPVLVVRNPAA